MRTVFSRFKVSLGPFSAYHDQNQLDTRIHTYHVIQIGIIQMQIGNLNDFGLDKMGMDQNYHIITGDNFAPNLQ